MKTLSIVAAMHRRVRNPETQELISESVAVKVPANSYWLRRLKVGDVVRVEQVQEPVLKKSKAKPAVEE